MNVLAVHVLLTVIWAGLLGAPLSLAPLAWLLWSGPPPAPHAPSPDAPSARINTGRLASSARKARSKGLAAAGAGSRSSRRSTTDASAVA